MPRYVDGFVLPLPKRNVERYRKMARMGCLLWMEHGALEYRECVGEDLAAPFAQPFTKGLRLRRGETVVMAWITFKSRAHRDRVNAKVMADPRIATMCDPKRMPFDPQRMLYGGFDVLVASGAGRSVRI